MKKKPFKRLQELVSVRQKLAYAQLQNSHKQVALCEAEIQQAEEELQSIQKNGREEISRFMSEYNNESKNEFSSKLSSLRALTARVDYNIGRARQILVEAKQKLVKEEHLLQEKQQHYYTAVQKVEKINFLATRFSEKELEHLNNIQEIDRLESGPGNGFNDMVR